MIPNNYKNSLLIPSQLPAFIQDDPSYGNFIAFIQAYYEWLEQTNNVSDSTKNILNYIDIDRTSSDFIQYFVNDFFQNFPSDALISPQRAVKFSKQLFQSKGTPASFKFLFRILYNSDFDVYLTKEAILQPSSGQWYVTKSLKLLSDDLNYLNCSNYRIFGETTKSIATIEAVTQFGGKTEIFISNIERLFQSGEYVRVVDSNNQDVLFNGTNLRAKIVGAISQIDINPLKRGLLYKTGDPVIVYGGMSDNIYGHGANVVIGSVTSGGITSISVVSGGYGYSLPPNTALSIENGGGASAVVGSLDTTQITNVFLPSDSIALKRFIMLGNTNYYFANVAVSNANTIIGEALSFESYQLAPISSVLLTNGGGGITQTPTVTATSYFNTDLGTAADIYTMGILAPMVILSGGSGYVNNDPIIITGGTGFGAKGVVTGVSPSGEITSVEYIPYDTNTPLGGMGYNPDFLPSVKVVSANNLASNASIFIPGILGSGASFSLQTDRIGSITSFNILDAGQDYIASPNVSLKVLDVLVSNVSISSPPTFLDTVYQGISLNVSSFSATVNSISLITPYANTQQSIYSLRLFNYSSLPDTTKPLYINDTSISITPVNNSQGLSRYNSNGVIVYGDASASATASFLNGLIIGQGQYISSKGLLSSFDVLQGPNYNNYTYQITVSKEIAKYREILMKLVHPMGMKLVGRYALNSNSLFNIGTVSAYGKGYPLSHYTGSTLSQATINTDFTNTSNNIISFQSLNGANLSSFISTNTYISLNPTNGPQILSKVVSINSNTVIISERPFLTFSNVATINASVNSNNIFINTLTGTYNYINNGQYSNTTYPLMDIVYTGDEVMISNVAGNNIYGNVTSINYQTGTLTLDITITTPLSNNLISVKRNYVTTNVILFNTSNSIYSS